MTITALPTPPNTDRKSTRLNSSHLVISYAVFCLKKKKKKQNKHTIHKSRAIAKPTALETVARVATSRSLHGIMCVIFCAFFVFFFFFFLKAGAPPHFPPFPPPPPFPF